MTGKLLSHYINPLHTFVFNLILAFGDAQYMDGSYTNTKPDMVEGVVNKAKDAVSGE